jgi:hypothetical protein
LDYLAETVSRQRRRGAEQNAQAAVAKLNAWRYGAGRQMMLLKFYLTPIPSTLAGLART